ncbi:hypothetical protein V2J09_011612 [Rumex salicifolius]
MCQISLFVSIYSPRVPPLVRKFFFVCFANSLAPIFIAKLLDSIILSFGER